MKINFTRLAFAFLMFLLSSRQGLAQDVELPEDYVPPYAATPALELVFEDDFSVDTREKYEINGGATWQSRGLLLESGAVLSKQLNCGSWVVLELDLDFPKLTEEALTSELGISFEFENGKSCFLSLERIRNENGISSQVSAYVVDKDGNKAPEPTRTVLYQRDLPEGIYQITYRVGAIEVIANQEYVFGTPIEFTHWLSRVCCSCEGQKLKTHLIKVVGVPSNPLLKSELVFNAAKTAYAIFQKADECFENGDYARALPLYLKAKANFEKVLGKYHPQYALNLNQLAGLYRAMGDYGRALQVYKECLALKEKVLGKEHPEYAKTLNNLAGVYQLAGEYNQALPLYDEALTIKEKVIGKQHPGYARTLGNIAGLFQEMGDYAQALSLYNESKAVNEKVLGKEHTEYAKSLANLAGLFRMMGEYHQALPLFQKAITVLEKRLGKEHPDYSTALGNLAGLRQEMGDHDRAIELYNEALILKEKALGKEHPLYARALGNVAGLYHEMGDYDRALLFYEKAKAINEKTLGKEHPAYAIALSNLAGLYHEKGDDDQALQLYRTTVAIEKKIRGNGQPNSTTLNNLASLHMSMGDFDQALARYEEAIASKEKVLGKQHPSYAVSLSNLASLYEMIGEYGRAHPLFKEACEIEINNFEQYSVIRSEDQQLEALGRIQVTVDAFISTCRKSNRSINDVATIALHTKGLVHSAQRRLRISLAGQDKLFGKLISKTQQLYVHLNSDPTSPSWNSWSRRKEQLELEKTALEEELASLSSEFRNMRMDFKLDSFIFQQLIPDKSVLVDFHKYLNTDKNEAEERLMCFLYRSNKRVKLIDLGPWNSIATAIEEFRTPLVVKTANEKQVEVAKKAGQLLREKLWMPIAANFGGSTKIVISPAGELGTLPFGALPANQNSTRYLIENFQIASLPVPSLLEDLTKVDKSTSINLLLVGNVAYDFKPMSKPKTAALANIKRSNSNAVNNVLAYMVSVANGKRDDPRRNITFGKLPETVVEIKRIEELMLANTEDQLASVKSLVESTASEKSFRELAPNFRILHIATHGFFAEPDFESATQVPVSFESQQFEKQIMFEKKQWRLRLMNAYHPGLLTGLAFAGANVKSQDDLNDDGIMSAKEISFMQLKGVDLVTLSACETGLGKSAGGEGLLGLQRAFQIAGAKTVVASLWKVDDLATRQLMERFYLNLFTEKMGKLEALVEAQRWMLKKVRSEKKAENGINRGGKDANARQEDDVRKWAAWVLAGDWRKP